MRTKISECRLDDEDRPIEGWAAENQPTCPYLLPVLEELAKLGDAESCAELGANDDDEEADALCIVIADRFYFTEKCSLRELGAWVSADLRKAHYLVNDNDGDQLTIPFADPDAISKAAEAVARPSQYD